MQGTEQIRLRLPVMVIAWLRKEAGKAGISVHDLVRQLLTQALNVGVK